jgi:hypothetical protein
MGSGERLRNGEGKMKATVTKFDRYERNGDSEASVEVNGQCVGFIKGVSSNVGSMMLPRYVIASYDVDVEVDGKT